ncbi:hypothetical protein BUALT_Bualt16G0117500 [Buddleja alternifolia]|uniref:Uncharacterized protein n=1 Tax=Buddleja alternifolia TaxID=168488 RepID=A0AAV6WCS3_9LAMI|nr:hypothetical protein BUALT_Bualt16G0117500 [Buddleja alternifolia]
MNYLRVSAANQAKDRQKKKGGTKGIRIDAEGGASLEDLANPELQGNESDLPDLDKAKSSNKKRKASTEKQTQSKPRPQKSSKQSGPSSPNPTMIDYELDDPPQNTETPQQRPKRLKRPTKSVNENIEPAFTAIPNQNSEH